MVITIAGVIGNETYDNKFTLKNFWIFFRLGISTICEILNCFCKIVGTCLYYAFLEDRFSFVASISITKPMGFKLQWNKCSIIGLNSKLHDLVPCCPRGLSPQLGIFCELKGFFIAFHFSNTSNVALSSKANAFEVKEMGILMLDLDLKGCKLHGRALLSFGFIWILLASKDPETWPLRGSLIDDKLGVNSTI